MNTIKVSVILPSYNVEAYIEETLKSALSQTLDALELICVDAGSTDGTRGIIDRVIEENAASQRPVPMRLIESDMKSYGRQVNLGIEAAAGEYVAILETDDIAAPQMYEKLYELAAAKGADIAKSAYFDYFGEEEGTVTAESGGKPALSFKGRAKVSLFAAISAPAPVFTAERCPEMLLHHPSIWSAIYKKDFLEARGVKMPELPGAGWADNPFMLESLLKAERIVYTPQAFYYYRKDNPGSSTARKDFTMPFLRIKDMKEKAKEFFDAPQSGRRATAPDAEKTVAFAIDYRALRYAADAAAQSVPTEGLPDEDEALIKEVLSQIPGQTLQDEHVTGDELAAYNLFTGAKERFTLSHRIKALAYKLKYGLAYFKNKRI